MDHLVKQIRLSLHAYKKGDFAPPISEIIIVSTLKQRFLLKEQLQKEITIPVSDRAPIENTVCQNNIKFVSAKDLQGGSLTVGLGLGLTDPKRIVNLAPKELREERNSRRNKKRIIKFSTLLLLTCLSVSLIPGMELSDKTARLNRLKKEYQILKPKMNKARQRVQQVQSFVKKIDGRILISDTVHHLYEYLLPGIYFHSLNFTEDGNLTIEGYSKVRGSINAFQEKLVQSSQFQNIRLQFATKRTIFGEELIHFKINTQLARRTQP